MIVFLLEENSRNVCELCSSKPFCVNLVLTKWCVVVSLTTAGSAYFVINLLIVVASYLSHDGTTRACCLAIIITNSYNDDEDVRR
jgi:hypothetical protein